jgi:hypothetical protein
MDPLMPAPSSRPRELNAPGGARDAF